MKAHRQIKPIFVTTLNCYYNSCLNLERDKFDKQLVLFEFVRWLRLKHFEGIGRVMSTFKLKIKYRT